jgi:uncharacterized protein YdhG (YjbR/CyaY superfamily)
MNTDQKSPKTIADYISGFPPDVQQILQQIRQTIREIAPDAKEAIKYQIPTFVLNGNMISFAAYKKHVSIYPIPGGTETFQQELAPYKQAKSTAAFPLDKPIPYDLISQLVKFRVKEHLENAAKEKK